MYIQISCLVFTGLFVSILLSFQSSLHIPDAIFHQIYALQRSSTILWLFSLLTVSFEEQKVFMLINFNLFFLLIEYAFGVTSKNAVPSSRSQRFCFRLEALWF